MVKRGYSAENAAAPTGTNTGMDRWRFALDHGAQGLWDWNLDSGVVYCSDNLLAMLGIDGANDMLFANWIGLLHADHRAALLVGLDGLLAGVPEYTGEYRIRTATNSYKWMRMRGRVMAHSAAGRPCRIVGTCIDIASDKAVEAALHESKERLSHVVSRIPGVVFEFVLRTDGTFGMPYASAGLHTLLRITPDEIREDGLVAFRYLDPACSERVLRSIIDSAQNLTHWSQELPQIFPDGERRWVYAESMPERQADGSVLWHGFASDITERKRFEFALQESEQRLRGITARIPGAVYQFRLAPDGNMTVPYASESIATVLRISREELEIDGTAPTRYLEPSERQKVIESILQSARTLKLWEQELLMTFADGDQRWLRAEAMPMREPDGATVWTAFIADVTERKHVELALRETDERLRRIASRIPGMVFEFRRKPDGSMSIPFASEAIRELYGVTPENVIEDASGAFAGIHVEDQSALRAAIERSAKTLEPIRNEYRLAQSGSELRWVLIDAIPAREADGTVIWHGMTTDITSAKHAEDTIRREKAFVESLVQNLVTPTLVLDPDGTVRVWNRALEHLTGVKGEQVVGTREHGRLIYGAQRPMMADIILAGDIPEYADLYAQFKILDGIPGGFYTENWFFTTDGQSHYVSGAAAPVYYKDGTLAAVVQTIHDLTDKQHMQVELERARDEALSATRTKSAFLANMSHEIRTPMNGVIGMTGLLLGTALDAEQREYAETIRVSGEHLLGIINDILDFSRIEAGRLELETVDFDLWQVLEEVAAALAVRAQERGLDFACFAEHEVPARLRGDPARLRQMLINLVGNAIKFTLEGEVTARAMQIAFTDTTSTIRFEVRDTGIGIAPDRVGELFTAFTQADVSTTRRFGGSGLGLAICKEMVGLMGGEIGVDSQPGSGSSFWFTVTLERQSSEESDTTGAALHNLRVLVVDDHVSNRRLLEVLLRRWGCRHAEAKGGIEALCMLGEAAARDEAFEVALLDMQMPDMDGRQLARRIKTDPMLADTRLVLLTSMGQDFVEQMNAADFAASLNKPLRQSTLYDCIASLPTRAEQAPPPAPTPVVVADVPVRPERLLLVEDNAVNQKVAIGLLRKMGYQADVVGDGASALEALTRSSYDLVFMDCQMPIMDGFAATRAIRNANSSVRRHDVPVVAMTANVLAGDREACIAAGMNDFLPKPISPGALTQMLDKWLAPLAPPPTVRATTANSSAKEFDRDRLLDNVMGDEELARDVLVAFAQDADLVLAELGAALTAGDALRSMRACHTLKGTTANVGALALFETARALEAAAREGDLAVVSRAVPDLANALAAFCAHATRALASDDRLPAIGPRQESRP